MSWYLKKEGEEVFGPVELALLKSWATTGRVAPDDQISEDQEHWIAAANLDDLLMDWVLKFEDGSEYGPLHAMTINQMVENGEVDPTLAVVHHETGEQKTAWEISLVVLCKLNRQWKESFDALAKRLGLAEASLAEASEGPKEAVQAAEDAGSALDQQREGSEKALAELNTQIAEVTEEVVRVRAENEQLTLRLDQSAQQVSVLQSSGGKPSAVPDSITDAYHSLSRDYELLMNQLSAKSDEIQNLMKFRAEAEQQAEQSVQDMSQRLRREQEAADAVRKRFREMEETHLQLVKAYREMNDRYIQLRHSREAAPGSDETHAGPKGDKKSEWNPKIRLIR